jgi:hypothetical protein
VSPLVTTTGPEDLAHLVHYGIVAAGLAGVTALVLPAFLERARPASEPRDEHQRRVRQLRQRAASGTLAAPPTGAVDTATHDPAGAQESDDVLVPVVVISSLAAAGVHAAVAPFHLSDSMLVGSFFVACTVAQLTWAALVWQRRTPSLMWLGVLGNAAILALWLVSRTVGVPGLGGPEPVGPWDATCGLWEVVVVVGCLRLRHAPASDLPPRGGQVHPFVLFWLVLSVLALALLSLSGAAA